ncbi:hypothetical protein DFH28DRAFT_1105135 [Melampsora americana]|nr:hypothetical protein DFH28DRAFT_1105135 [Melampsora americana]
MASSIPNPNHDSPLCCCCGEDYPDRNKTQAICDPCQWNKDNPTNITKMVPCFFCSEQFEVLNTRLCGLCKKYPKAVAFFNQASGPDHNSASCPLPAKSIILPSTFSSQPCFISLSKTSITSSYQPSMHSRSSLDSRSCALAPLALDTVTPASDHYAMQVENSIQRAITQAHELQSCQRQQFESNFTKPHWMLDLTVEACDYFRDNHSTFPSPQQLVGLGLHSLPPYYKEWYYLGKLGKGNPLITKNYLCFKLISGRGCKKSTGKRNVEDELLDLPPPPSVCPQSITLQSHPMKKNTAHKSSVILSLDSKSLVVLNGSINSNSIDDHDYTPLPTRTLNVKCPESNMQSIKTQTSPLIVQSKVTQTFNEVMAKSVDIMCPEPLHQVMKKLIDDSSGGRVGFSDLGIMQLLGRGTLPVVP